jgi:glycosyltransferase involved in cell wall biosynthesis
MRKEIKTIFSVANAEAAIDQLFFPSNELDELLENGYQSNIRLVKELLFSRKPSYVENLIISQKSDRPILSLITSLYKGDRYIKGFLENTCNQIGFENFELIILNCNSPGNEESIILEYCKLYSNIIYRKLESDPGLYQAWNLGIQMSSGKYVSNANLDDRRSLCYYALMLDWMTSNNIDVGASLFWTCKHLPDESMDEDAIIWYKDYSKDPSYFDFFKLNSSLEKMEDQCILGPMPIWKKSLHNIYGYFDEEHYGPSSDYAMWCKLKTVGAKFGLYKVPLVYYLRVVDSYARRINVTHFNEEIIRSNFSNFLSR